MVAEIAFNGWSGDGVLRQAAFKGIREDKEPGEVTVPPGRPAVELAAAREAGGSGRGGREVAMKPEGTQSTERALRDLLSAVIATGAYRELEDGGEGNGPAVRAFVALGEDLPGELRALLESQPPAGGLG